MAVHRAEADNSLPGKLVAALHAFLVLNLEATMKQVRTNGSHNLGVSLTHLGILGID